MVFINVLSELGSYRINFFFIKVTQKNELGDGNLKEKYFYKNDFLTFFKASLC